MVVLVLGLGLIALVICGASAVLADITNNVRNMNRTDGSGDQGSAIEPDEEADQKKVLSHQLQILGAITNAIASVHKAICCEISQSVWRNSCRVVRRRSRAILKI